MAGIFTTETRRHREGRKRNKEARKAGTEERNYREVMEDQLKIGWVGKFKLQATYLIK
jgi:hypothetical protein